MGKHTYILIKPETSVSGVAIIKGKLHELSELNDSLHFFKAVVRASSQAVLSMYGRLPVEIAEATARHLAFKSLTVFKVYGDDQVIELISAIKGDDVDPIKCARKTLRRMIVDLERASYSEDLGGGVRYHKNFVHIPKNEDEVVLCDHIFARYFI